MTNQTETPTEGELTDAWRQALTSRRTQLAEGTNIPAAIASRAQADVTRRRFIVGSFWAGLDASYRLPVLIAYLALVVITTFWPADKNLGELIALSAALLVASQFWFLDEGGALVLLYLPLVLLMMFRPNLSSKRPSLAPLKAKEAPQSLFPVR